MAEYPIVSPHGRFVVWPVPCMHAHVADRESGTGKRTSVHASGLTPLLGEGYSYGVSPGGRFALFGTYSALVDDDTNDLADVYIRVRY